MRVRNKGFLLALPILALAVAFWFLLLAPKREEAGKLEDEVAGLQASVSEQEQIAEAAEQARKAFPRNYRRVVVLGKAVPEDSDTSSLLVQLTRLAHESGVDFRVLELADSAATAEAPATSPSGPAPAEPSVEDVPAEATAPPPAEPTETAVANLPLGAVVGPAGLPVMPYELQFRGDFFAIAEFIAKVNKMVDLDRDGQPAAFGRLITIDGFALTTPDETDSTSASSTTLEANFAVTTYVTPEDEGATAGATPTGPAPPTEPVPASDSPEPPAPAPTASAGASIAGATP